MVEIKPYMRRLVEWVVPRLSRDHDATLDMIQAAMTERYCEGIDDAADVIERVTSSVLSPDRKAVLAVAAKALRDLAALNRKVTRR